MLRPARFSLRRWHRFAFTLILLIVVSCLVWPDQHLSWLLRPVSATATSVVKKGGSHTAAATSSVLSLLSSGVISFGGQTFSVNEGDGSASITLARTGGSDGVVSGKVALSDVTTSSADYVFSPGTLDPTFVNTQATAGTAGSYAYPSIALQPDGKLLVGDTSGLLRLNPNGSRDATFMAGISMNGGVECVAIQPDGKIIVGGSFTTINNQRANRIARLNTDGSLDTTFDAGTGANQSVSVIVIQPDGKVLVSGYFDTMNGTPTSYFGVARLNSDGSLDSTYKLQQGLTGRTIALQPDGKILGGSSGGIFRANPDGTIDSTFNAQFSGTYPWVFNIAVQPDGKIIIVGIFDHVGGQVAYGVARLNADGSVDPTFNTGTGPDTTPQGLALQPDGKVLIGGGFKSFNGTTVKSLVRLNTDGSLDPTFNPGLLSANDNAVNNILLQPDGKVFIRGYLTATGSNIINRYLARLRNDLFVTWRDGDTANKTVSLPVVDDLLDEPDETLNLTLTPLTSGVSTGTNASATLTITDNDAPPVITSALPPSFVNINTPYSHTFMATGSPAPTYSVTTGSLPPGIFLSPAGVLSGSPFLPGTSNVTVTASNGVTPAATQTFSIKVNGGPNVSNDLYTTTQNIPLTVAAPGVLSNDTDPEGDPLTAVLVANPNRGTVTLNSDGSFIYTPNANISGGDFFTYRANDGHMNSEHFSYVYITINSGGTLQFTAHNYSKLEDGGTVAVTVGRAGGVAGEVMVDYTTSDGTATAGTDYTPVSGTLVFGNGVGMLTINVPLAADSGNEPDETINLTLSNARGTGTLGAPNKTVVTILNDDSPRLEFTLANQSVAEGAGQLNVSVVRTGDPAPAVAVDFGTGDSAGTAPCNTFVGRASSRCDYAPRGGTLQFAAGEIHKTISIPIVDDGLVEGTENFSIRLVNPTGAFLGSISIATLSITDNEVTGVSPALKLALDESGPNPNQATAFDSILFLRDPFTVISEGNLLNQGQDRNTRVIIFLTNLQLAQGELSSSVIVSLLDSKGQSYEIGAEAVQPIPYFNFTQVIFRLPDNLSPGTCTLKVKAHGQESNAGTIRIGG